ncbi:MAG: hypothetical protein KF735_19265 [Chelatococcus sp.]|uniref:hypothetical protein n=1 Tax=Chelatococcus sp. TaxID=1953771 RepID=UPI0025C6C291|nr:hypothetical protein [Chelatococcus sp.]MBX3539789.1 hypothetical protein [Chelatococcus sp.]
MQRADPGHDRQIRRCSRGETPRGDLVETPHGFADSLEFGSFPLVAIEWLEFPLEIDEGGRGDLHHRRTQDIAAIRAALDATGKALPLQVTETGLRIVGHRFSK